MSKQCAISQMSTARNLPDAVRSQESDGDIFFSATSETLQKYAFELWEHVIGVLPRNAYTAHETPDKTFFIIF